MKKEKTVSFLARMFLVCCIFIACVAMSSPSQADRAPSKKEFTPLNKAPSNVGNTSDKKESQKVEPKEKPKLDVLRDVIFPQIYNVINNYYVDEPDQEKMITGAINGMLSELDPHSVYMGPKEYYSFKKEHYEGTSVGVGVYIVPDRGAIRVVSPIEDTPAHKAGLKPGDYITKINGEYVFGLSINEAIRRLKGTKAGTSVDVTIFRGGENIDMTIQRAEIKINSVKWGVLQNVGYVRISTFDENSPKDFAVAVKDIKKRVGENLKGIVIDVRSNPGGLLNECVEICGHILDGGVVVSSKGRNESQNLELKAQPTNLTKGIPLVVMVDEGSASAAEILAAAVQDYKRGLVLGTQSYGKGTVQIVIPFGGKTEIPEKSEFKPLKEERAIKVTIARYYSPLGRSIQAEGVTPDILVEPAELKKIERHHIIREKDFQNSLASQESMRKRNMFFKQEKKKTPQKEKAGVSAASKKLDQERLEEMYDQDYQFLRAIDAVKTLSLVSSNA